MTIQRGLAGNVFDTDVSQGYGSWAAGNYPGLWTGLTNSNHWTLVEFDLSPIPAGAQIVLSTFSIYEGWSDKPGTVRAHRITAEWDEQTTSFTSFGGVASWDPAVLATFDALGYGYKSIDLTTVTQGWYSGLVPAHGILLEEDPVPSHGHGYSSSESSTAGYRPRLDVCYVAGGPCAGKQDGDACDDGNLCTTGETCQAGQCGGGQAVTCTAQDACHDAGICDPASGQCTNPLKPNGASCNDQNACTGLDYCLEGACIGISPVVCGEPDPCHDPGTCDPATGTCSNPNKADGTACDDGSVCSQVDTCQSGTCTGQSPLDCNDGNPCTNDACDPASGCGHVNNSDPCNDGNACTANDVCQGGACAGAAFACDDGNACTTDSCDTTLGCQFAELADFTPCGAGTCVNGECDPEYCTPDPCDDGLPCTDDTCSPTTGCSHSASQNCGGTCGPEQANCDADPTNGCETSLTTPQACGACGVVCITANGTPSCIAGSCGVAACDPGWANCDCVLANGCETNTATDAENCGACGVSCTAAGGAGVCVDGACTVQ